MNAMLRIPFLPRNYPTVFLLCDRSPYSSSRFLSSLQSPYTIPAPESNLKLSSCLHKFFIKYYKEVNIPLMTDIPPLHRGIRSGACTGRSSPLLSFPLIPVAAPHPPLPW